MREDHGPKPTDDIVDSATHLSSWHCSSDLPIGDGQTQRVLEDMAVTNTCDVERTEPFP
jgi:hypothetical protein